MRGSWSTLVLRRLVWPYSCLLAGCVLLINCQAGCAEKPPHTAKVTESAVSQPRNTRKLPTADEYEAETVAEEDLVPAWATEAVFYQIFPERFRNGDSANDPTRDSLEFPSVVPTSWQISPWNADWYARAAWEEKMGDDFYEDGVFHRRYGGDLQGVLDKLDYLEKLGINCIYFNPVFYARSMHKYDGNSFHHVDPHFGPDPVGDFALMATETSDPSTWKWTAADKLFLKLIEEAKARNIRIVIDGVFNHSGKGFFAFEDIMKNQAKSPYVDWYMVESFDDPATPQNEFAYKGWWGVDTLPEFANTEDESDLHPGPKQYIMDATARWMDPNGDGDPSDGIDGWRLDVANEVPTKFWRDWHAHVRSLNKDAYTVAEFWHDAKKFLDEGQFSATMNYHGFAFPAKGFLIDGAVDAAQFAELLKERRETYNPRRQRALQNLIDSHDTDRVASMIVNRGREPFKDAGRFDYDITERVSPRNDRTYAVRKPNAKERRIQRLVALFQMTYVGAPMIYYGTESGMWGADDPCDRMPMVWQDMSYDAQSGDPLNRDRPQDAVEFEEKLWEYYAEAIKLRKNTPALNHGEFEVVRAEGGEQVFVFSRTLGKSVYLIAFNRSESPADFKIPLPESARVAQRFTASGEPEELVIENEPGAVRVKMPGLEGVVLRRILP